MTATFRGRVTVPPAQSLAGLLEGARNRWQGKVAVRGFMHDLWFSRIAARYPFIPRVMVAWSDGVFEYRLLANEAGRQEKMITVDRCFEPNAQVVLDAFLYQLTGQTSV